MRFVILSSFVAASMAFGSATAVAAEHMKPGLWDITVKSDALAALSAIPQAQLDKLRAMGVRIPKVSKASVTTQACITPDMASSDQALAAGASKMGCTAQNSHFEGNSYSTDLVCDSKHAKGTGKVSGTFVNDQAFTSQTQFKGTVDGVPVDQQATATGKWVGADCGDVKPLSKPSGG